MGGNFSTVVPGDGQILLAFTTTPMDNLDRKNYAGVCSPHFHGNRKRHATMSRHCGYPSADILIVHISG